jgi:hypothetical protein
VLLPVLLFTLITSTLITSFLLFLFLAHRLYLHLTVAVKHDPSVEHFSAGVKSWADETKARVDLTSLGLKGRVRWADMGDSGQWKKEDEGLQLGGIGQEPAA